MHQNGSWVLTGATLSTKSFKQIPAIKIEDKFPIFDYWGIIISVRRISSAWKRKQVKKAVRRAHSRFLRYRLLRVNNNKQILYGYRMGKGNRSSERHRNGEFKNYHRRHNRHEKSFY